MLKLYLDKSLSLQKVVFLCSSFPCLITFLSKTLFLSIKKCGVPSLVLHQSERVLTVYYMPQKMFFNDLGVVV